MLCVRDQEERPPSTDRRCVTTTAWTNGEPVVTDMENGVQWMGCIYGRNQRGCVGGQVMSLDHQQAFDMCTEELNWAGIAGGWRLPTLEEATRIIDLTRGFQNNNLDPYVFPARQNHYNIWTSTPYQEVGNDQISRHLAVGGYIENVDSAGPVTFVACATSTIRTRSLESSSSHLAQRTWRLLFSFIRAELIAPSCFLILSGPLCLRVTIAD